MTIAVSDYLIEWSFTLMIKYSAALVTRHLARNIGSLVNSNSLCYKSRE